MKQVLVVDDEAHTRALITRQLEKAEYRVTTASNGGEALERLREGAFDVVVTDYSMPGISGEELCQRIRQEIDERVPLIVVMTSHLREELGAWVDEVQNIEFFQKPLSLRKLTALLETHFASAPAGDAA